jgi:2,3-bisphosphoglycerate-dependent phosphoglycerate mutase
MGDVHCPARLILARPGEAAYEIGPAGGSGGSLTALGRGQARELAQVLCSELSRAVQTAEIAAAALGLSVEVRGELRERADGETDDDVAARAVAVLDEVADRFRGETVLVVSHGGVIGAVVGRLAPGSAPAADAYDVPSRPACVLERDADGWRVG